MVRKREQLLHDGYVILQRVVPPEDVLAAMTVERVCTTIRGHRHWAVDGQRA